MQWEHDPLPLVTAGLHQYSTFNRPVTVVSGCRVQAMMHVCIVGGYMYMCWSLMCYVMNPIDNHIEYVQKILH